MVSRVGYVISMWISAICNNSRMRCDCCSSGKLGSRERRRSGTYFAVDNSRFEGLASCVLDFFEMVMGDYTLPLEDGFSGCWVTFEKIYLRLPFKYVHLRILKFSIHCECKQGLESNIAPSSTRTHHLRKDSSWPRLKSSQWDNDLV
jgi:hypothetical protein